MARKYVPAPQNAATREAWLNDATDALRPRFEETGMPIPEKLHISVGFGYGAKRESAKILGQCWAKRASADDINHVFISPELSDAADVLAVLVHELIHAADDCANGHKGAFAEAATRLGLEGKMTATVPGVTLYAELLTLAEALGEYPHGALQASTVVARTPVDPKGEPVPGGRIHSGPSKQGTRMLKLGCPDVACPCGGYSVRTSSKWIAVGLPRCPFGTEMTQA